MTVTALVDVPQTVRVPAEQRDWNWASNARKRRELVGLVLRLKGNVCHLCGTPGATTADHVIPWSHGGANVVDNLNPAHSSCNSARGDRTLHQWFARRPLPARPTLAPSREW